MQAQLPATAPAALALAAHRYGDAIALEDIGLSGNRRAGSTASSLATDGRLRWMQGGGATSDKRTPVLEMKSGCANLAIGCWWPARHAGATSGNRRIAQADGLIGPRKSIDSRPGHGLPILYGNGRRWPAVVQWLAYS